jgi:hypothetical protein
MQLRVSDFLRKNNPSNNVFVVEAEAAESEAAKAAAAIKAEAEMDEYLLRRAEQELQTAQAKIDSLKRKMEERRRLLKNPIHDEKAEP